MGPGTPGIMPQAGRDCKNLRREWGDHRYPLRPVNPINIIEIVKNLTAIFFSCYNAHATGIEISMIIAGQVGDGSRPFPLLIDPRFCGGILSNSNGNKL